MFLKVRNFHPVAIEVLRLLTWPVSESHAEIRCANAAQFNRQVSTLVQWVSPSYSRTVEKLHSVQQTAGILPAVQIQWLYK